MDKVKTYNGYVISIFYAGLTTYVIEKDGNELYYGWSVDDIIERFGFNPTEI